MSFNIRPLLTKLSKKRFQYEPLINVEISSARILDNLESFSSPSYSLAPVLKSNAYGHGLVEVARILQGKVPFMIVDSYFEALTLRKSGLNDNILIIGYTREETILENKLQGISFAVTSLNSLKRLTENTSRNRGVKIQLKFDTGMRRQGLMKDELPQALALLEKNPRIHLEGIFSHLADSDNDNDEYTLKQISEWNAIVRRTRESPAAKRLSYWHLSASEGYRFADKIDANVLRLGIGLYGITSSDSGIMKLGLKPALSVKSIITNVKKIKAGDKVGYNGSFVAPKDMIIATVPAGYFEGIDRRLSNTGVFKLEKEGTVCPIIGKVSMNITTVDISDAKDAKEGDCIVLISCETSDLNSMASIAKNCGIIPYEIAVHIPAHLKRTVR